MNGYSHNLIFSAEEIRLWRAATELVGHLPENDSQGRVIRCHEVARLVQQHLGLHTDVIHDGVYLGPRRIPSAHSWLLLRAGALLDPYAVGRLPMVQLIDTDLGSIHERQYRTDPERVDIREDVIEWLRWQVKGKVD